MKLTLYYRSGCSLCEDMERELRQCGVVDAASLRCIDIDRDVSLRQRYDHKVPVLTGCDDEEICHYFLDLKALQNYFATH